MAGYPTRVRYGLRLLVRLALQGEAQHVSIGDIAQEEGVSVKYLEQIVSLLKPLGILASIRGAHGGYILTCNPVEVTMDQVFESLGGLSPSAPCFKYPESCPRIKACTTMPFWRDFDAHTREYLRKVTLAQVMAGAMQDGSERKHGFRMSMAGRSIAKSGCASD